MEGTPGRPGGPAASLDQLRQGQRTQQAGFDKIVSTIAPIPELLALAEQRRQGGAIDGQLRARHLPLPAFLHLMRVRELAVAGSVLDSEWADVYAVIVQFRKVGLYAAWRRQEQQKGLILGPDVFQLSDPAGSPAPAGWPPGGPHPRAARPGAGRSRRGAAGADTHPGDPGGGERRRGGRRCRCSGRRAWPPSPVIATGWIVAERLTRELGIDCRDSGHQRTTRAQQALQTLQEVLLSLRTGRLKTEPPVLGTANPAAEWELALDPDKPYIEKDFDEEWLWMGGYGTWNAAIRVFAYPETYLLPELRPLAVHQRRRGRWTRLPRTSS